jgi:hypothetical protein
VAPVVRNFDEAALLLRGHPLLREQKVDQVPT